MHRGTLLNTHRRLTLKRRNCWIKFFSFLSSQKYSCIFITLWLNCRCHMDYFNDVLISFLDLERGSPIAVYAGSESSWISSKYLNLCSEDDRRSYGLDWNDMRVSNFWMNYPFKVTEKHPMWQLAHYIWGYIYATTILLKTGKFFLCILENFAYRWQCCQNDPRSHGSD